jgi:putative salt-induced outer membrane protein YdiY
LIDNGKKILQFKSLVDLQYDHGPHTFLILNDLNLMSVDQENLVNSGFEHFSYNFTARDISFLTFELFFQHQYNQIKLLKRRFLVGFGPRFRIIHNNNAHMYIGALGMYENEQLSDSLSTRNDLPRLASYLSFSWDITDNVNLNSISYYQPAFTKLGNFRMSMETSLEFKITGSLSLKVGIQTNYDSKPPEDIQKLFYFWENGLTYHF